jgi:hypothetical protein
MTCKLLCRKRREKNAISLREKEANILWLGGARDVAARQANSSGDEAVKSVCSRRRTGE